MRTNDHYENHFTWAAEMLEAASADVHSELRDYFVARAQVHATLALAAATRGPEITVDFGLSKSAQAVDEAS